MYNFSFYQSFYHNNETNFCMSLLSILLVLLCVSYIMSWDCSNKEKKPIWAKAAFVCFVQWPLRSHAFPLYGTRLAECYANLISLMESILSPIKLEKSILWLHRYWHCWLKGGPSFSILIVSAWQALNWKTIITCDDWMIGVGYCSISKSH